MRGTPWGVELEAAHALALGVSVLSLLVAGVALVQGAPARLRDACDRATRSAQEAVSRGAALAETWEASRASLTSILDGIQSERERVQKDRARLSARESRERNLPQVPQTRDEILTDLRKRVPGLLSEAQ